MRGKEVFYPMGWDDNGLPTERRVQNYFGVRCDPSLPYDPDFTAAGEARPEAAGRRSAGRTSSSSASSSSSEDEQVFEELLAHARPLGRLDAAPTRTIGAKRRSTSASAPSCATSPAARPTCRRRPTLWDVTFQTAVAQAELEARGVPRRTTTASRSTGADGDPVYIETTRPELIPAWSR